MTSWRITPLTCQLATSVLLVTSSCCVHAARPLFIPCATTAFLLTPRTRCFFGRLPLLLVCLHVQPPTSCTP